jgi:hypothetical protein
MFDVLGYLFFFCFAFFAGVGVRYVYGIHRQRDGGLVAQKWCSKWFVLYLGLCSEMRSAEGMSS